MDLVVHHVLQALVVGWADEDLSVELATCEPVVQNLGGRGGGGEGEGTRVVDGTKLTALATSQRVMTRGGTH